MSAFLLNSFLLICFRGEKWVNRPSHVYRLAFSLINCFPPLVATFTIGKFAFICGGNVRWEVFRFFMGLQEGVVEDDDDEDDEDDEDDDDEKEEGVL